MSRLEKMTLGTTVALVLAIRVTVALADHRALISLQILSDDAFYYFKIARNVVESRGMTFDGLAPTNGFHPLWLVVLLPIVAIFGSSTVTPLHAGGVVLAFIAAATTIPLFLLARRTGGSAAGLLTAGMWTVSPYFVFHGMNGHETGLAGLFAITLVAYYVLREEAPSRGSARRTIVLGILGGIAILARLDTALLLGAISIDILIGGFTSGRFVPALRRIALMGGVVVLIWVPWGIVSHTQTGEWLPTSGQASRELALNYGWSNLRPVWSPPENYRTGFDPYFDSRHPPAKYFADVSTNLALTFLYENPLAAVLRTDVPFQMRTGLRRYTPMKWFRASPLLGLTVLLTLAAAWVVASRRARPPGEPRGDCSLGRVLAIYGLLMLAGYTFYSPTHWFHNRYLFPVLALATVQATSVLAVHLGGLRQRWPAARHLPGLVYLVLLALPLVPMEKSPIASGLRWKEVPAGAFLGSWEALKGRIEPGRTVGAFQAGTLSWFSGRDVVNLDGKVNPDAMQALRDRRTHEYILGTGVDYLVDWEWLLHCLCTRHAPETKALFRKLETDPTPGGMSLFRVLPPGERRLAP